MERILPRKEKEYFMPTEVVFGRGAIKRILEEPIIAESKRIVLMTGNHFKESKELNFFKNEFADQNKILIVYENSVNISDIAGVNDLTDFARKNYPDLIISIGGGTIIDLGKCAAVLVKNGGKVEDYLIEGKNIRNEGIKFVAVPTTAGTGSEVTPWATVWDTESKQKYSFASPMMFPDLAIVDPSLTDELPPKITAETGMDALTQGIEAFWSKLHNPVSDEYALRSIRLVLDNLDTAVNCPNEQSRDFMAQASLFAGLAFSNTKTTICHSVSYPMTAHFGVTHGQAVSITLPIMMGYSFPSLEKERGDMLLSTIGVKTVEEASGIIKNLIKSVGMATTLAELGINEKNLDVIVQEGFNPDRVNNAPKVPSPQELKELLKGIL